MTTSLVSTQLLFYADGRSEIYATWQDEIGSFAVIHDSSGRAIVTPEGISAPRLTPAQLEAALTPPQHPVYALAAKGAASRPDLAERMEKAAALVEGGAVRLLSSGRATVGEYRIGPDGCTCKDYEYRAPDGWCKHRLAVRMARALGQAVEAQSDAEKEAAAQDRVDAEKAAIERRVYEGRQKMDREWKQARRDGDGARRWMWSHLAHNETTPVEFYNRATGAGQEAELAEAKAAAVSMTPEQHLQRYAEIVSRSQRR